MQLSRSALVIGICLTHYALAQSPVTFKTRLAPVAIDTAMKANVAGAGAVQATLSGTTLAVSGTFDGLRSPATAAQVHQGTFTGVRGPAILDLSVTKAASGSVSGSFELTPDQVESLKKGKWYIQIDSEKAAQGNLWGWLLK